LTFFADLHDERAAYPVGQTLGQTASFRQTAPETWCQSRVCGVFPTGFPTTVSKNGQAGQGSRPVCWLLKETVCGLSQKVLGMDSGRNLSDGGGVGRPDVVDDDAANVPARRCACRPQPERTAGSAGADRGRNLADAAGHHTAPFCLRRGTE